MITVYAVSQVTGSNPVLVTNYVMYNPVKLLNLTVAFNILIVTKSDQCLENVLNKSQKGLEICLNAFCSIFCYVSPNWNSDSRNCEEYLWSQELCHEIWCLKINLNSLPKLCESWFKSCFVRILQPQFESTKLKQGFVGEWILRCENKWDVMCLAWWINTRWFFS